MKQFVETYVRSFENDIKFNGRKIIYRYLLKLKKKYQKKEMRLSKKIQKYEKSDFELMFDRRYLKVNEWRVRKRYYLDVSTLLDETMNRFDEDGTEYYVFL